MDIFTLLTIILVIFTALYLYVRHKYRYWENRGVPFIKPTFPFGNLEGLVMKEHFAERNMKFYKEFKGKAKFGGMYFFMSPAVVSTDLDFLKTILIKDFNVFTNRGSYYNEKHDPLSAHLLNIEDDRWKNLRSKLTPTFTSGKIKSMFETLDSVVTKLITKVSNSKTQESVNIFELFGRFTTDVIASCAFGIESNSLNDKNSKFYEMGQKAFETKDAITRMMRFSLPNLARKLGMRLIREEMSDFYYSITKDTVEYREKNSIQRNDFMNLLIQMKNTAGSNQITLNEIAAQSLIFYVAGHETTATTLTYCFYELSKNIELQEKAREHVKEVLMKHNNEVNYDTVGELTYIEQIINETLRKYPPATGVSRVAKQDYKVPGTNQIIEKGIFVIVPIYSIHHDPEIYPKPEIFDPDRFSPEEVKNRHPMAFIPFGEGPRICIGLRFAMTEAKLAVARLLLDFKFVFDSSKTSEPIKPSLKKQLLQPEKGIFVKIEKL